LHDTCGAQYAFGLPGIIGGLASAAAVGVSETYYKNSFAIE